MYWAVFKFGPKNHRYMIRLPGQDGVFDETEYEYPVLAAGGASDYAKAMGYTDIDSVAGDVEIPGFSG